MAIQYASAASGYVANVNNNFTSDGTYFNIFNNVPSALVSAGWSIQQGNTPSTVSISIASPAVITWNSHGLTAGTRVYFFNSGGALPSGITANNTYYVISAGLGTNTFEISTSSGGSAVNTSGSQSGTQYCYPECLLQSATTSWSVKTRVRMRYNAGNSVDFSLENGNSSIAGTNGISNGGFIQPSSGKVCHVIANQYQAFVFYTITTPARGFVAFGTPYVPSFLQTGLTDLGWLHTNIESESGGSTKSSFRTAMYLGYSLNTPAHQSIVNSSLVDNTGNSSNSDGTGIVYNSVFYVASGQSGTHFADGSALMTEPLIAFPTTGSGTEGLIRGQLWDAVIINDTFAGDTTTTFDSHNWWAITDSNSGQKCTLFVVTP